MKLTPKGMRDISPEDMYLRKEVIATIESIFRLYGFRPLETPALEYLSTLKTKAGDEVTNQIFVIDGNEYGLRFDLTVPLARYASATDAPKPFKRYAIDRVWRKEEPQRGRFREFYQADVDIVGSSSMRCEIELLTLAKSVCAAFGFDSPRVLLNNRKILDAISNQLNLTPFEKDRVFRILDKLDKIGQAEVQKLLEQEIPNRSSKLMEFMTFSGSNQEKLALATDLSKEGADELRTIVESCPFVEIDFSLVRGLGYYTGPIYEVKLSSGMGTVLAGGRYDELLGVYGQSAAAVGISVGVERLITLLGEQNPTKKKSETVVFVASLKPELYGYATSVCAQFRSAGICAESDLNERSFRKQFDYTNALSIPYLVILGEKEVSQKMLTLKNLTSGKEELVSIETAINALRAFVAKEPVSNSKLM
ncbi:histidine--tRNA ligase [Candidatus Micrarchaeota archaeon]|nr:histidine--tRNA ligase [Candidatus Micrarchaeota archaeon]